ncbi:MAG: cupin domain-containing protein [Anaerolineales bacterium]|nr:MAG: cupin domain-containing protein [Anaerolineales bacterium]
MKERFLVRTADQADFVLPKAFESISKGFSRWTIVNGESGSVHQEFNICELEPGGQVDTHLHTFEESVYVLEGELICETGDGSFALEKGDYGLIHVGAAHGYKNRGASKVRWVEMLAPQPRLWKDGDVFPVKGRVEQVGEPIKVNPRDTRTRFFGNITDQHMDPGKQSQELLAVSGSMRTALLVYTGITVKMMVDSDLGAHLHTMFMVKYIPGGGAGSHDHPFEETYMILDGEVEAWFDNQTFTLKPGDVAWAGVGCVHGFKNKTNTTVQWLETSAPQSPSRHAYRFGRDWDYFEEQLKNEK